MKYVLIAYFLGKVCAKPKLVAIEPCM